MISDRHPKKALILYILEVLKKYTDDHHTISQKEILDKLKSDHEFPAERKSIKRNIDALIDLGYDIQYTEIARKSTDPVTGEVTENNICSDFHIVRDFTDSELRMMITSIMAARNIPYKQKKDIVKKLEDQSSMYFRKQTTYNDPSANDENMNRELFYTIDVIETAIAKNLDIYINYADYHTDKKLHLRPTSWDPEKANRYTVSPYYIVTNNARLYLICSVGKMHRLTTFRLDRIKNIRLTEQARFPQDEVDGMGKDFSISEFMSQNFIMVPSVPTTVTFRIKKSFLGELFDTFTGDMHFSEETETDVKVRTTVGYQSMKLWAVQFADEVLLLSPQNLVDEVKCKLAQSVKAYEEGKLQYDNTIVQ